MEGYQWGGGWERIMREKVQGIRSINVQNRQGEFKNSIGNVQAKELICMTHGHELGGMLVGGGCRVKRNKGEKKMDNCNNNQ